MKNDLYTKGVLTVIAACLLYLCLGRPVLSPTVQAQSDAAHVMVAGWVDYKGYIHTLGQDSTAAIPVTTSQAPR